MNELVENIKKVYNLSTESERAEGLVWYADARKICVRLSKKYNVPVKIVCYVMAALSPNNKWQRNITDTKRVLEFFSTGELSLKVACYLTGDKEALKNIACTYTANLMKAFYILQTNDITHLKGLKTNNFALNIYHKNDSYVTVDYHAVSIAQNFRYTIESIKSTAFRAKQYHEIAEAYKKAGEDLGLQAKALQAITWVAWRNVDKAV